MRTLAPCTDVYKRQVLMCAVNPVMGFLNTGLSKLLAAMGGTSRVALGVILGAMMAIDMGGPCNKACLLYTSRRGVARRDDAEPAAVGDRRGQLAVGNPGHAALEDGVFDPQKATKL